MGGELRAGATGEPVPDGLVGCDERGCCQPARRTGASAPALAFFFQTLSCDFLGMDGRVCRGRRFSGHAVGQRARVLCAMSALSVDVARSWAFFSETADLFASRSVGSVARAARVEAWPGRGGLSSGNGHACTFHFGQGWMGVRLLAVVAGVVPGGDGPADAGRKQRKLNEGGRP